MYRYDALPVDVQVHLVAHIRPYAVELLLRDVQDKVIEGIQPGDLGLDDGGLIGTAGDEGRIAAIRIKATTADIAMPLTFLSMTKL